jgi:protein subunit release factor B
VILGMNFGMLYHWKIQGFCSDVFVKLTSEINKVSTEIDAIQVLLKKPFQTWSEEEKEVFGNKDQLRKKKEQQLLKQQTMLRTKELELLKQQKERKSRYFFTNNSNNHSSTSFNRLA